jgi:hypothetical protein
MSTDTDFPDYFVEIADSYGQQLIEGGISLYTFRREDETLDVVMSESGGCDARYRPAQGHETYYHVTVSYEIEGAMAPLIDDGWELPEIDATLREIALQDRLAILREQKAGLTLTTPDLVTHDEYRPLRAEIGRKKSRSGELIVMMQNEAGEEFAVYETVDGEFVSCVIGINAQQIEWYEIEPYGGIESATVCWLETGYELVKYDEEATQRISERIRKATLNY